VVFRLSRISQASSLPFRLTSISIASAASA
jgi:hypothetical protein